MGNENEGFSFLFQIIDNPEEVIDLFVRKGSRRLVQND